MKRCVFISVLVCLVLNIYGQKNSIEWVYTTSDKQWVKQEGLKISNNKEKPDAEILLNKKLQSIEGFGGCFNELGWISLYSLNPEDRSKIMEELFAPDFGATFNICRMPVGANDFSRDWYSYDETDGDFALKNFSIENDRQTLIPFIKNALNYNPDLNLWASPWSPPSWMKYNKHYACAATGSDIDAKFRNGLDSSKQGREGTNMFIQKDEYFKAYAKYFSKFIKAYREEEISISTIMPQNEFNSCQIFPSCTWTAKGLATFVGKYLGPEMQKLNVGLMFGTFERPSETLADTVLKDVLAAKYIKGMGFQWAGKKAIAGIHKRYPNLKLYQSEQECGDGKNDWTYCKYTWNLMKYYFNSGASAYMYWNISLFKGGFSRWGWQQNSLVTVDSINKTFQYNYEYYLMKHLSHYVKKGARMLKTSGDFNNILAFQNPDKSIVIVCQNDAKEDKTVNIKIGDRIISPLLKSESFNTFLITNL